MGLGLQPLLARALMPLSTQLMRSSGVANQLTVLTYHRIGTCTQLWPDCVPLAEATVQQFAEQMSWLRTNATPVDLARAHRILRGDEKCPPAAVLVTFDDGYVDALERAAPALLANEIRPCVFLATDYVGTRNRFWWDRVARMFYATPHWSIASDTFGGFSCSLRSAEQREAAIDLIVDDRARRVGAAERNAQLDQLERELGVEVTGIGDSPSVIDWDQARSYRELMDFAAHTRTHAELSKLSASQLRDELAGSKAAVERELGADCVAFAIPYGNAGAFTDAALRVCDEVGLRLVFSLCESVVAPRQIGKTLLVNRTFITQRDGTAGMAARIAMPRLFC